MDWVWKEFRLAGVESEVEFMYILERLGVVSLWMVGSRDSE